MNDAAPTPPRTLRLKLEKVSDGPRAIGKLVYRKASGGPRTMSGTVYRKEAPARRLLRVPSAPASEADSTPTGRPPSGD